MKKTVFLIGLLFPFFGSFAQTYTPFPEANVEWVSKIYYVEPQMKSGSYCYDSHIETIGDTMMGGHRYIKLKETKVRYWATLFFCSNQIDTITTSFFGWFRNDTLNKKVYFRKRNWSKDELLYDFNLQIGDTVPNTILINNTTAFPYIIDTIKNVNINNINREVYFINRGNHRYNDSIIEGIGNSNGLFTPFMGKNDYYFTFLCMNISGAKIYPPNGSCPILTSIQEKGTTQEPLVIVYPNPVQKQFKIKLKEMFKIQSAILYDCTGRVSKEFLTTMGVYDVEGLSAGIYFLQIKTNIGFYSKKLVIK